MEPGRREQLIVVDGGQALACVVHGKNVGEVEMAAVDLLQSHLHERAGVQLPQYAMADTGLEIPANSHRRHAIFVVTLVQMRDGETSRRVAKRIEGLIGPEGFYVGLHSVSDDSRSILVVGADERGLLYGMGRLLRSMRFAGRDVIADVSEVYSTPAAAVRGHLLANHIWSPQYDNWDEACWDRYLGDLSLWGVNTILTSPYHPGEWAACRPFDEPPVFLDESVREAWDFYWRVQRAVPRLARKYGMRFGFWIPPNDIPVDEARPQTEGGRCDNVCPSQPDLRALILKHREAVLRALDPVDLVIVPASDCGGCSCAACSPWVRTYISLAEEVAEAVHRLHPDAWMGVSNQNLSPEEDEWLCDDLEQERPAWLRFVVHGPGSSDLAQMRERIPADYDIFMYPDITHLAASDGYLFEDLRTDPLVWRVYQQAHLEATPFARPEAISQSYPQYRAHAQGSFPYSEGTQDDLNKVIWSQLDWDPTADVADIVREYCAFYFGHDLSALWYRLERAIIVDPGDNAEIAETLTTTEEVRRQLSAWALHGWRWQMLEVRVLLDRFLQLYQRMGQRVAEALSACATMEHPALPIRDLVARIRDAGPRPIIDDLRLDLGVMFPYYASAEAARRERKEYGEPPSHPLRAQLDSWTPELRELELLDHRIQVLSSELRREIGLELRAAWIIRGAKTPYDWCLDDLDAAACGPESSKCLKEEIARALEPEEGQHGGTYDDLGDPERQPHLHLGHRWEDAFGDISLRERLAAERRVISPWGEDIVLRFDDLRSDVAYELRVTYVQSRSETRSQRLVAVSAAGVSEVHAVLLLPTRPRRYTFVLPAGTAPDGQLELRFVRVDGRPLNATASEVWLTPAET